MALWGKKKTGTKITNYLKEKNISYQIEETIKTVIKFELCFTEKGFMLYPYITLDENKDLITFNVNVSQLNPKNNMFNIVNDINKKSIYLKAYVSEDNILVLEYRFNVIDDVTSAFDSIISDLFSLENIISEL